MISLHMPLSAGGWLTVFVRVSWLRWLTWLLYNWRLKEWLFYNLVLLIKLCKIGYLNLDKVLLFPRNHVICFKNWKFWRAPTTIQFNIFCWNFGLVSYLTTSTKWSSGFFSILFRSWIIKKNVKNECVETRSFFLFENNSRSKQN